MSISRITEYIFFFTLLALSGYMVWLIAKPFLSALALAAVIVTIAGPMYHRIIPHMPWQSKSVAAFVSTMIVFFLGIFPIVLITGMIIGEVSDFYQDIEQSESITFGGLVTTIEQQIATIVPGFEIDIATQIGQLAQWFTGNFADIFASTLSLFFLFFVALIASFYFFRDGQDLLQLVIKASPLPDTEDKEIFRRLANAIRSVFTGTILVAIIQATLATVGMLVAGVDNAILIGCLVAIAALIPGVGTGIVMVPVSVILIVSGNVFWGVALLVWSLGAVGIVDNVVGPHLMSRGNNLHPFIILISVLGGMSLFGPIGFLIGPMMVTLFLVLLEIYNQYIVKDQRIVER